MKVRYLIKFTKNSEIKFISHLDLMRTIQRTIRRAGIDVQFSKGFNPRMNLSLAQPLAVGVYSHGDYLDLNLLSEENEQIIIEKLNKNAPIGVKFLEAINLGDRKVPQSMAAVEAAVYVVRFQLLHKNIIEEEFRQLLEMEKWEVIKKGKSGERLVDLKPMLKDIKFYEEEKELMLKILVSCGSRENLSPQILGKFITEHCKSIDKDKFIDIRREETFAMKENKYIPLSQFYKEEK